MKNVGKLLLLLVLVPALSLGLAASVWAQPMGKRMGHGPGMMNLTPEQAGKIFDLREKVYADTAGLGQTDDGQTCRTGVVICERDFPLFHGIAKVAA